MKKDCCSNNNEIINKESDYICYCNKITKQEIIDTVKSTGFKKINEIKKYLRDEIISDCVNKHPLKRCCSPEFKKIIDEVL